MNQSLAALCLLLFVAGGAYCGTSTYVLYLGENCPGNPFQTVTNVQNHTCTTETVGPSQIHIQSYIYLGELENIVTDFYADANCSVLNGTYSAPVGNCITPNVTGTQFSFKTEYNNATATTTSTSGSGTGTGTGTTSTSSTTSTTNHSSTSTTSTTDHATTSTTGAASAWQFMSVTLLAAAVFLVLMV